MRIPRIYHPDALASVSACELTPDAANHVARVLRLTEGAELDLFCGDNNVYRAVIQSATKKSVQVAIQERTEANVESPIQIHLLQGISRGERMDFVLQKSVELGVTSITPLFTERCNVKLQGERLEKKTEQWQRIVISACAQSGRNYVPKVNPALTLTETLANLTEIPTLLLDPTATRSFKTLTASDPWQLLIGPEGGFSESEVEQCKTAGCIPVTMGPRVLRTETAALTAITALQCQFGDLAQ
ncbi:MAG: 16S rRNA (uracil(1498)-N(3))-methyltransferase [Idiomarina sp.]|nr:16S rRNA (uracil(1498)-N(3))-methyltransferase [Idiomarina sp.]